MNIFDRAIEAVAPVTALKRMAARKTMQVLNYGYSEGGASGQKKSMRGWRTNATSPKDDIDSNLNTLTARSRDLYMNAPLATAALKTMKTNVIGPGLKLKCHIDAERLGITEDQASAMGREIEREFSLWAESKHCDALKMNDFNDLQGLAFLGAIMNGDAFAIFKYTKPTPWMPYGLRLHLIEGDRVSSPYSSIMVSGNVDAINPANQNRIISGIELDSDGAVVAYHVSNQYAISTGLDSSVPREWKRIEAFGRNTGRPNVLHLMETERAEQRRGVPVLAPVIETLKQLTRYTEAELMASVVAGMFTVFVKTTGPSSEMSMGEMVPEEDQVAQSDPTVYEMANAGVNILGPGESIEIANPGRPNSQFDAFITSLTTQIGAALEIPRELLQKAFTSSYSASRAALLEAWKMFRTRRTWVAKEFNQPVYEEWMDEAVGSGRIKAPGYFNDPAIRRAYLKTEWTGLAPGMLNPSVEVAAAGKRIELGLSTHEKETVELTGGDFARNVKQLAREAAQMKEAGLVAEVIPVVPVTK
ncbi:phage portal protein [Desulfosporosinus sp. OT]|uniref:phage portal protein n=1 Tax=Desulfosporosinus sp. OT TaxID=913865 RepID=UPI000223A5DF|nr:phage portal protein [Desulfosporosinus sp. OT]EGW39172.1 phage portal protein, lambda family [Desulfosporosinus sp. OT]